jgi:hypothetical protein
LAKAIGAAGLSKFKEKGEYGEYLFVTELDKLKDFNKTVHKVLILDDISLKSLYKEQVTHLLASSNESVDIRCRNTNARLSPYVPRIITTNNIKNILKTKHEELLRRCLILFIEDPMLGATGEDFYHLDESVVEVYPLNLVNNITNNGNNNTVNINLIVSNNGIKTSNYLNLNVDKDKEMQKISRSNYDKGCDLDVDKNREGKK